MKFLKFLGWSLVGLILLAGLAYGFLPTIGRIIITQGLNNHGFTNVEMTIDRPGLHALMIPSLAFRTPPESGSTPIIIQHTEITYSLDSLLNNALEAVNIGHIKIVWDSSLLERSSDIASIPDTEQDLPFAFPSLNSGAILPVLPFRHLRVNHVDISNPLAPPTLQKISLTAEMDLLPEGYSASMHLAGRGLLLNFLTFSLTQDGNMTVTGAHTDAPEDLLFALTTTLERSSTDLKIKGKARFKLHPFIHTLTALYPLPPHYQSISGTFSGNWTGTIKEKPLPTDSAIGPIQGDFALEAKVPTWPPFAQDIQGQAQGTFAVLDENTKIVFQLSSSGSVNLALGSLIPPSFHPFLTHKGLRSITWNIRQPVQLVSPIQSKLDSIQIPSGQIHMAMRNASEQLDMLLSPKGLLWKPEGAVLGEAHVSLSTQLTPGPTPTLLPETIFLETDASLLLSQNQIALSFNPSSYFRFSEMTNETIHIPTLVSRFPKGASATYISDSQTLILETTDSTLFLPSVSMQDQQWTFQEIFTKDLTIRSTPKSWAITGASEIKKVHVPFDAIKIPDSNWQTRYSATSKSLSVQFKGQTLQHPVRIGGQAILDLEKDEAVVSMSMQPILFAPKTQVLSQIIQPWPFPGMDVTHGGVSASAEVTLAKNPTTATTPFHITQFHGILDLKDISGFIRPTILEGLDARIEILGEDNTFRIPPTPLHIKRIQSAIDLTETFFILSSGNFQQDSPPTLSVRNVSTHLLGGTVALLQATYDPSQSTQDLALQVHGLDLGEILRLEQQETVKGTGTLDGHLPLFISGKNVEIHQGTLNVRPPGGILQMTLSEETASSWTNSQPNLDLIVQSLANFHYSQLDVGVDYDKNGILKLAAKLKGKNPDFRKGVPIHFNLNIEEDIPALLESLSLVQNLEDKIGTIMTGQEQSIPKKDK